MYEKYVDEAAPEIQTRYRDAQDAAQPKGPASGKTPDPVPPWEWPKEKRARLQGFALTQTEALQEFTLPSAQLIFGPVLMGELIAAAQRLSPNFLFALGKDSRAYRGLP